MRVLVVHSSPATVRGIRQTVLGAGGECSGEDCVRPADLSARLAQVPVSMVVVRSEPGLEVDKIRDALSLVNTPCLVTGDDTSESRSHAQQLGAEFIPEHEIRSGLEPVLHRLMSQGAAPRPRGTVISVFASVPGSGGTTVASNLAGAFAAAHPKDTGLVEIARDQGDLALLLNIEPEHTAREACERWAALDRLSLGNSFVEHPSGASVLINGVENYANEHLSKDSVRRLAVLSRFLFAYTVFALEGRLSEEEFEVMKLSDRVVLVVRPDVVAVRRAKVSLERLAAAGISRERVQLVVNRWGQPGQLTLVQIESTVGLKAIEQIPDDPSRLNQATNQGLLLQQYARRASISKRFDALAHKLNGQG